MRIILVANYFSKLFKALEHRNFGDIMKVSQLFPNMFSEEDNTIIWAEVTLDKLKAILVGFQKSKSLGPDGGLLNSLKFYDLVGSNLIAVVEETRTKGLVVGNLNSTFINLILKCSNPLSFNGFSPISLSNLAYKVITKFLENKLKQGLSEGVSKEQFDFLFNRNILDPIGTAQEGLHSIKSKKYSRISVKIRLDECI